MIGESLRLLRVFYGLKSAEVAEKLGLSQGYVSDIENCRRQPSLETLEKYAKLFDVKLSTLILFSEEIDGDSEAKKAKQYVAKAGMKFLKILDKIGKLEDA